MWRFLPKYIILFHLVMLTYITSPNSIVLQAVERKHCEAKQQAIKFTEFRPENSAEEYELPSEGRDDLTFQLSFCTHDKMATMVELKNMSAKQSTYIQIFDGIAQLSVEQSERRHRFVWNFSDTPVNDGVLHKVKFKMSSNMVNLQHYRIYELIHNRSYTCVSDDVTSKPDRLVLGGEIINKGHGSKIDVQYNFAGKKLTSQDVNPGCPLFSETLLKVCPPTAIYQNGFCVCPGGTEMDEDDVCSPSCSCTECRNGGTCFSSKTGSHCTCPSGYTGLRCEVILDPCSDVLCNNGSCNSSSLKCICSLGFKGEFCNETDKCFPNPCRNGGTCHETVENVSCLCPPTTSGKTCEEISGVYGGNVDTTVLLSILIPLVLLIGSIIIVWHIKPLRTRFQKFVNWGKGVTVRCRNIQSSSNTQGVQANTAIDSTTIELRSENSDGCESNGNTSSQEEERTEDGHSENDFPEDNATTGEKPESDVGSVASSSAIACNAEEKALC